MPQHILYQYWQVFSIIFFILKYLLLVNSSDHNMIYSCFADTPCFSWHIITSRLVYHIMLALSTHRTVLYFQNRPLYFPSRGSPVCEPYVCGYSPAAHNRKYRTRTVIAAAAVQLNRKEDNSSRYRTGPCPVCLLFINQNIIICNSKNSAYKWYQSSD